MSREDNSNHDMEIALMKQELVMIREFQKESTEAQKENTAAVRELTTEIKTMAVKNSLQEDRIQKVEALAEKNKERHDLNQSKLKLIGTIGTSCVVIIAGALMKLFIGD